jgi:hypothetical protein
MPTLSLSKNQGSRAGIRDIYHIVLARPWVSFSWLGLSARSTARAPAVSSPPLHSCSIGPRPLPSLILLTLGISSGIRARLGVKSHN